MPLGAQGIGDGGGGGGCAADRVELGDGGGGQVCRWAPKDVAVTTLLPVYLALAGTGGGERQRRASRRTP